ncbi:hypothetical protein TIFTF001_004189 [Ficus carica]|uniref:Uncharacterized protein n=1 Tax=Ficus carica TaxID=3494 RepID=A0AA87ZHR2_FICCA|nr:hypothetical protein TIFTF001_004189 [Ficus carica]
MLHGEEFRLDPSTKTWEVLPSEEALTTERCVVDGVSNICFGGERFGGFDEKVGRWKLAVAFAETTDLKKGKVGVWCAEIDVTDDADGNWWGRIHWSDKVLLLPEISWGIPEENFYESPFSCLCKRLLVSL